MPLLSASLEYVLHNAISLANARQHEYATLEHLLLALLDDSSIQAFLVSGNVDKFFLKQRLQDFLDNELNNLISDACVNAQLTAGFQRVLQRAIAHGQSAGQDEISPADLLVAFFAEPESHAVYFLQEQDISRYDVMSYVSHGATKFSGESKRSIHLPRPGVKDLESIEEESGFLKEGLESFFINLNDKARSGSVDPLIARESEMNRMMQVLFRRQKNNPLLIGDSGVGKTAIVEGLADHIVRGLVPDSLRRAVILQLDIGALLAGTRYRGDFEKRLKAITEMISGDPDKIIFIDEIHTLVGAGATSSGMVDASNLLKPILQKGSVRCIGATTHKEYRQRCEKDLAFVRRFQKIEVNEPTVQDSIRILRGLKTSFEKFHKIRYTDRALQAAVELSVRYLHDRKLPDKAIDVIDETAASGVFLPESRRRKTINEKDIEATIALMASIPPKSVSKDDLEVLRNLETNLKQHLFGQDEAVEAVATAVKLSRAGLRDSEKTIGSYLFSGSTGVGKTEVARRLAELLGLKLIRFDMSEYMERHAVSRLIGAPPGYVGFDHGGLLTDLVDQTPHCLVLLDEIEKAHPDIFNLLLQVMDHGKLTDSNGKQVDFRNVILIMTTNAGATEMAKSALGFTQIKREGEDGDAINRLFTPEFRNRLDAIIPFNSLSPETIMQVVRKFVAQLKVSLAKQGITLDLGQNVLEWLAERGYDPQFGARPLSRLIQDSIKRPLSDEILFGRLRGGGYVCAKIIKNDEGVHILDFDILAGKENSTAKEGSIQESSRILPQKSRRKEKLSRKSFADLERTSSSCLANESAE